MSKLFLISGLGADERLFKNLDLSGFNVVPVTWIEPNDQDSLTVYATKLIRQFGITPGSSVIGVSLGGMLTVEVAKQVELKHAIIISSIKSGTEAPWYFGFCRALPVHKLISGSFIRSVAPLIKPLFSAFAGKKEAPLFYSMLKNSDPKFLGWAKNAVIQWKGKPAPYKINHLIGDKDAVFHHSRINDAIVIHGGDHAMVFTRATDLNPIIRNILTQ